MNNGKKLLLTIFLLFITVIFQIVIIIRLNILDNRLDRYEKNSNTVNGDTINNFSNPDDNNSENINSNSNSDLDNSTNSDNKTGTNANGSDSNYLADDNYSNLDNVLSDDNLSKHLNNSLFVGDSRTDGIRKFTGASKFASFCCDVGISINKITEETFFINVENLTLYDAISKYKYDNIYICIGYNELGWKYEDTFIEKYKVLIDKIKEISPESHINIMAILHISSDAKVDNESENNERIDLFNSKIQNMCSEADITYIDLNSYFIDENGFLKSEATTDGIHFNSDYYKKYLYRLLTL
ncbi:MAG: GDSL-type esterase/lipase family protein [Lachnospiraceae bacterium]|nr:GDSL-type esterase/lipase family protein [Lachnospiraceae bacterium]